MKPFTHVKGPCLFVPQLGTCNWRELSGFIKLVIQMLDRKGPQQADLGGECREKCSLAGTGLTVRNKVG